MKNSKKKNITNNTLKIILSEKTENIYIQFFRYIFVGGFAAVFDIGCLYIFTEFFYIYYLLSACLAFLIGLIINYLLSILWVFQNSKPNHKIDFFIFGFIGIIGLILNILIIWLLSEKAGLWYIYSKFVSTGIVLFWNFLARKFIIFDKRKNI